MAEARQGVLLRAMKCNRVGCDRTDVLHIQIPIMGGAFFADAYFCPDHYKEGVESMGES